MPINVSYWQRLVLPCVPRECGGLLSKEEGVCEFGLWPGSPWVENGVRNSWFLTQAFSLTSEKSEAQGLISNLDYSGCTILCQSWTLNPQDLRDDHPDIQWEDLEVPSFDAQVGPTMTKIPLEHHVLCYLWKILRFQSYGAGTITKSLAFCSKPRNVKWVHVSLKKKIHMSFDV